jgi:hypothetical protein
MMVLKMVNKYGVKNSPLLKLLIPLAYFVIIVQTPSQDFGGGVS